MAAIRVAGAGGGMKTQDVTTRLVKALELLHRAKAYVNKYPSIGAQELSKELAEFLSEKKG